MDLALPLASSTVAVSATAGVAPVSGDGASADDAARFAQLMAQPAGADAPGAAAGVAPVAAVQAVNDGPFSFGDAILQGLGAVGDGYARSRDALQVSMLSALGGSGERPELGMAQILALQMSSAEWSLQLDVITKVTQQTGQHINELGKLQ
jgi:hypothetical protein